MIPFRPRIYPDELVYSLFARYYVRSGYLNYVSAAEELFGSKTVRPNPELFNPVTEQTLSWLTEDLPFETLIKEHTVFNYYARYIDGTTRREVLRMLRDGETGTHLKLRMSVGRKASANSGGFLRYCPVCAKEDRARWGECYWHVSHQLPGIDGCVFHGCELKDSSVSAREGGSPCLYPAEAVIPEESLCDKTYVSEQKRLLNQYAYEVFKLPLSADSENNWAEYLRHKLVGTRYISPRGGAIDRHELYRDFCAYYPDFDGLPSMEQLSGAFNPNLPASHMRICMLTMFLQTDAFDLLKANAPIEPRTKQFDDAVRRLHFEEGKTYSEIAKELNASLNVVKPIGAGHYLTRQKMKNEAGKGQPSRKSKDWKTIDQNTLPLVQRIIREKLGETGERPRRITIGSVASAAGMSVQRFRMLEDCVAYADRFVQTQEEYWIVELKWAVEMLNRSNLSLTRTNLSMAISFREAYYRAIYGLVTEPELKELVGRLISKDDSSIP